MYCTVVLHWIPYLAVTFDHNIPKTPIVTHNRLLSYFLHTNLHKSLPLSIWGDENYSTNFLDFLFVCIRSKYSTNLLLSPFVVLTNNPLSRYLGATNHWLLETKASCNSINGKSSSCNVLPDNWPTPSSIQRGSREDRVDSVFETLENSLSVCLSVLCQQIFSFSSFNLLFLYSTVQKSVVQYRYLFGASIL